MHDLTQPLQDEPAIRVQDVLQMATPQHERPYAEREFVLNGLSFTAPTGQVTALVGSNGAGKTTALNVVTGAAMAHAGTVDVLGRSMTSAESALPLGASVVQDDQPYPGHWTAHDVARLRKEVAVRFDAALFGTYLREHRVPVDRDLRHLSQGQATQLMVGAALAEHPQLLIMDEPLARLDPLARETLIDRLREHMAEAGEHAILLSTHDLTGMDRFIDHLVLMSEGICVLEADVESLQEEWMVVDLSGPAPRDLSLIGAETVGGSSRGIVDADDAAGLPADAGLRRPGLEDLVVFFLRHAEMHRPRARRMLP